MFDEEEENPAEFFTPPNTLKEKVGHGGISDNVISQSQAFINDNKIEYEPYAQEYLANIDGALRLAEGSRTQESLEDYMEEMTTNIMQLKASGAMFGYDAITKVADVTLNFIERAEEINDDLFKIVKAQNVCLDAILKKKIKGKNSKEAEILSTELYDAIERYRKKYNK